MNNTNRHIYLYGKDKDGKLKPYNTEQYQTLIFENDVIRLSLNDRGEQADKQLIDDLIYLSVSYEGHYPILKQIIDNGLTLHRLVDDKELSEKYIFYTASTGQVRNQKVTLIKQSFLEKHRHELYLIYGADTIKTMNVGKYLAYTALSLSSSVLPDKLIDIDRCLVVPDLETTVTDMVKYVDIGEKDGQCYVKDIPTDYQLKDIEITQTDGAGMFLPGELPSSCQIRGGFIKGAMFPFDFLKFAKEVAHNTVITDVWGNQHDIVKEDIRFIFTKSQCKMAKKTKSWNEYKEAFKRNHIQLSVNSYCNPASDTTQFAYQYLQTLPYNSNIKPICDRAKQNIIRLYNDIDFVKETLKLNADDNSVNAIIGKAIGICPSLIYDDYIQDRIAKLRRKTRNDYRAGKIPIHGYYSYAAPDMYAFCQFLFQGQVNPKGLIPKNHIYNKYYDSKNSKKLICLRSPHLSNYEYGKRNLIQSESCKEWFQYMETDTVCSCHDLLSKTLQMDYDGDEILVCDDELLLDIAKDLPDVPLYYDMQKAGEQAINNDTIYDTLVKGFQNNVIGTVSNSITKLWNTMTATKDNPTPYDDAISVFTAFSNYAIDFPKTGKSLDLGEYTALYDKLSAEDFNTSDIKPPKFFKYAKHKKDNNIAEYSHSPMDRICKYIGQGISKLTPSYKISKKEIGNFDYRQLMNNETRTDGTAKYEVNRYSNKYLKLYQLLHIRKQAEKEKCAQVDKERKQRNVDISDTNAKFDTFYYFCLREIKELFTNTNGFFNEQLAVNYMIDLEYCNPEFKGKSKEILWRCFGHIILNNLQKNIGKEPVIKCRPRMSYIKVIEGNAELDKRIDEKFENRSIDITASDMAFINNSLRTYKNGNEYKNDRELLFTLYCLYKVAQKQDRLNEDRFMTITQKKHFKAYNSTGKPKIQKVRFNMNTIMQNAGAKSYKGSFKRFNEVEEISIVENTDKQRFEVRFNVPNNRSDTLFTVANVFTPITYLKAYMDGKTLNKCKICGKDFIKDSPNQKTCSDRCKRELRKFNMSRTNERMREARAKAI